MALGALGMVLDFDNWKKDSYWYVLSSGVLFSSCALCYNEILPFIALSTFFLCVRFYMQHKEERKSIITYIGCCGLAAMGYVFAYIPGMIKSTLSQLNAVVGWHQNKDINTYLSYFLSIVPAEYNFRTQDYSVELLCYEIFTLAVFVLLLYGIRKSNKNVRRDFLYASIPYIFIFIYFMFFTENPFI